MSLPLFGANFCEARPQVPVGCDFTRSAIQTVIAGSKLFKDLAVGSTELAINYNAATQNPKGLMMASTRSMMLLQSDDLTASPWASQGTTNVTAAGSAVKDPYGMFNGQLLVDADSTMNAGRIQVMTIANDSNAYTGTVIVRKYDYAKVTLQVACFGGVTPVNAYLEYNFDTKVVTLGGPGAAQIISYEVTDLSGDGLIILKLHVANNTTGNTSLQVGIYPCGIVTGDAVTINHGVYCFRASASPGGPADTGLTKTTTLQVTRTGDMLVHNLDSSNFVNLCGTVFLWMEMPQYYRWKASAKVFTFYQDTDNYMECYLAAVDGTPSRLSLVFRSVVAGVQQGIITANFMTVSDNKPPISSPAYLCVGVKYDKLAGTAELSVNGVTLGSATGLQVPPALTKFFPCSNTTGSSGFTGACLMGYAYYPYAMSSTAMNTFTEV